MITSLMTGVTLFILGALKVRITNQKWYRAGLEMLLVEGIAAAVAYVFGGLLKGVAWSNFLKSIH